MPGEQPGPTHDHQLLERDAHLAQLHEHLDAANRGGGRFVLVGGSAGIGKSALLDAFRRSVDPTVRVLRGACDPLTTQIPLAPLVDIAAELGPQGNLLTSESDNRLTRYRAFLDLLYDRRHPTLVIFEDVHWADEATLDLLRFAGRRISNSRAMLVASYRNDEIGPDHPLRVLLGDIATYGTSHRLTVPPLSLAAVETLTEGTGIDPFQLHQLTGGNAFFITEVLAAGGDGIPATVRDAVLSRAARLSTASRSALDAAAVAGSPAELSLLHRLVDENDAAIDACVAAGMLAADGGTYRFRHEIARQAVIAAIPPRQRVKLHRRVLEALEAGGADGARLARLAHHAEESDNWQAVLRYAPEAARHAAGLHAHREAASQLERALRFASHISPKQRAALLEEYALECYLTDQLEASIQARRDALSIWRDAGAKRRAGENLYRLARVLVLAGRNAEAEQASLEAIALLEAEEPGPELAAAYQIQAHLRMLNRDNAEAIEQGLKAIELAKQTGAEDALIYAHNTVGSAMMLSNINEGRRYLERSAEMARAAGVDDYVAGALGNLGTASGEMYLFEQADRYLEEGVNFCKERDLDFELNYMRSWQALSQMYQGRWTEASRIASDLLRLPQLATISGIMSGVALGRVRTRRGDPEAMEVLDIALESARQTGTLQRLGPVYAARAEAAWLRGDWQQTQAEARAVFDLALQQNHPWFIGELAYWRWKTGDLQSIPEDAAQPYALQMRGDWKSAAAAWMQRKCPYEAARALAESDDLTALNEAFSIFDDLGASPARALVARRLRELDAPTIPRGVRPATRANPARLTRRQMEVGRLIVSGLTNDEIAARLFISPKTVEHHITALYAKLQVTNRAEAIDHLQQVDATSLN